VISSSLIFAAGLSPDKHITFERLSAKKMIVDVGVEEGASIFFRAENLNI
jgi:hypothetical protein